MRFKKFTILHLILAVLVVALALASFVEQRAVIGESATRSPNGDWCLKLQLLEYSTLFTSRKVLDADVEHSSNPDWTVKTSIPLADADAKTISDQHADHPIVWSEDSSTVSYWINEQREDWIKIEASEEQFKYQRDLYSTTVTIPNIDG